MRYLNGWHYSSNCDRTLLQNLFSTNGVASETQGLRTCTHAPYRCIHTRNSWCCPLALLDFAQLLLLSCTTSYKITVAKLRSFRASVATVVRSLWRKIHLNYYYTQSTSLRQTVDGFLLLSYGLRFRLWPIFPSWLTSLAQRIVALIYAPLGVDCIFLLRVTTIVRIMNTIRILE